MKNCFVLKRAAFGVMLCVMLIMVTSCSKSKEEKLMDRIPADADMVIVCDVKSIVESLDGTVDGSSIQIPDDVFGVFGNRDKDDLEEFLSSLEGSGIDAEVCALFGIFDDEDSPYIVFPIEDREKFINLIQSKDYEEENEEDGWTIYVQKDESHSSYIGIKDSYAYLLPEVYANGCEVERKIKRMAGKAENNPFSKTNMCRYIAEGNAGGVSLRISRNLREMLEREGVPAEIAGKFKGYVCCRGNLNDNRARFSMKIFDKNGEEMKAEYFNLRSDVNATLNQEAMKYLHKDEFLLVGLSLKGVDWDEIGKSVEGMLSSGEKAAWIVVKSYLEKIGGTVACGVGMKGGVSSFENMESTQNIDELLAITMVIEIKKGKARSIVNDMKVFLEKDGVQCRENADGFRITVPGGAGNTPLTVLNVEAKGNYMVLSNRPIKQYDNSVLKNLELENKSAIAVLDLPKGNELLKDFGIEDRVKVVLSSDVKTNEVMLELEFGETGKGGLMGRIMKAMEDVEESPALQRRRNAYEVYDEYSEDDFYEDEVVEEYVD